MEFAADRRSQPELIQVESHESENTAGMPYNDTSSPLVDREALAYLLRYETMVRQQEAENMATMQHLQPLLQELQREMGEEIDWAEDISYDDLQTAVDALETTSNGYMATDRQLMMVLKTLTQKNSETTSETISWAEFLQCYKSIVVGMQTLQHITDENQRQRVKDRTLTMVSLFEPAANRLLGEKALPNTFEVTVEHNQTDAQGKAAAQQTKPRGLKMAVIGALIGALAATSMLCAAHPEIIRPSLVTLQPPANTNSDNPLKLEKQIFAQQKAEATAKDTRQSTDKESKVPVKAPQQVKQSISVPSFAKSNPSTKRKLPPLTVPAKLESMPPASIVMDPKAVATRPLPARESRPLGQQQRQDHTPVLATIVGGSVGAMAIPGLYKMVQTSVITGPIPGVGVVALATIALVQGIAFGVKFLLRKLFRRR